MCVSKIINFFDNLKFLEKELDFLEDKIVFYIRKWLKLNNSSTRSFMFIPKSKGGLGVINPRIAFYAKRLSFILSVLNSDDEKTKLSARSSLFLHFEKRKAVLDYKHLNTFAGYVIENNKIVKHSKVYWSKSYWIHIFEMCQRENIQLLFCENSNMYKLSLQADEETSLSFSNHRSFQNVYKMTKIKDLELKFKALSSQGRVARDSANYVDPQFTGILLNNTKIASDLISFVYRARLQLLQCNSLMNVYFKTGRACALCNNEIESVAHVLNGCSKLKSLYQSRHDRVVNLIFNKIQSKNCTKMTLKDTPIKPSHFNSNQESFVTRNNRPDIVLIDHVSKSVTITEIAIPFDGYIKKTYETKFDKYFPLCLEINAIGYRTNIIILLIGSLGHVSNKFISGLIKNNLSRPESKHLARFCSTSAMLGSLFAWKKRCRLALD